MMVLWVCDVMVMGAMRPRCIAVRAIRKPPQHGIHGTSVLEPRMDTDVGADAYGDGVWMQSEWHALQQQPPRLSVKCVL